MKAAEDGTSATKVDGGSEVDSDNIDAYFEAQASADAGKLEDSLDLAAPDSLAYAYAKYQLDSVNAAIDGGVPYDGEELSEVEDGYEVCDSEGKCTTWADVETTDGKIAKFTVDGNELQERISIGDGTSVNAGSLGTIEFLTAYQSVSYDGMIINIKVTSKDLKINLDGYSAKYRGPDKRQSTAANADGPSELDADSTAYLSLGFDRAKPGGTLTLTLSSENYETVKDVKIKTR